jgi:hypothetical protein
MYTGHRLTRGPSEFTRRLPPPARAAGSVQRVHIYYLWYINL